MRIVVLVKPVPDPASAGERLGPDGRLDELERLLEHVFVVAVDDGRAVGTVKGPVRSEPLAT